jgi:hypothetical protein
MNKPAQHDVSDVQQQTWSGWDWLVRYASARSPRGDEGRPEQHCEMLGKALP